MNSPTSLKIPVTHRSACSACGASVLEEILDLPRFPLTGVFVKPAERERFVPFDQALLRCAACGHAQLRDTIDPSYLYQETYTHRSSLSPIATRGNDFLFSFLEKVMPAERRLKSIAEIGCNDLYLLKKLTDHADNLVGFDPIWKDHSARSTGKIRVVGKYIEEIDPPQDIAVPPDLVISANTLEHVDDPLHSLQGVFNYAAEGAIFVVEVPSFDTLINTARYDQVFHQHLNYFSLASFQAMIRALGGEYLTHCYNYEYWLGTMLIAFRKPTWKQPANTYATTQPPSPAEIAAQYKLFGRELSSLSDHLQRIIAQGTPVYGYGAAQMVPTLAYHLRSDLAFLKGILDDNPGKKGLTYPGLQVMIEYANDFASLQDFGILITAPDSARPILNQLISRRARYIYYPFNLF